MTILKKRIAVLIGAGLTVAHASAQTDRPNIILILADDMGFSDLGCYGSEIKTPNIDKLANQGIKFSRFYNNTRSCPTRASLLTGLYPAQTGIGDMTNPPNRNNHDHGPEYPGYRGFMNRNCVTIAEALKPAGYATLMSGKWHLGTNNMDYWPLQRGFEKYYGCLDGATRYFFPKSPSGAYFMNMQDTVLKSTTDKEYYTTDAYTDYAIRFIKEEKAGKKRPFFLYLAYNAPHWPLQAHESDIDKYRETYKTGWDNLREQRYKKQIEAGLINPEWKLSPRQNSVPAWESLAPEKQKEMALRMAVYAAMIDRMDQNIGKLMNNLKEMGIADNTLIMFLSDNGACEEGGTLGRGDIEQPEERNLSNDISVGEAWANLSNTPFRLFKRFTHEGGVATPYIACWPSKIKPQKDWYDYPATIMDIMPTLLEISGARHPERFNNENIYPLNGISLLTAYRGRPLNKQRTFYFEHFGNASMIEGDWKLVGQRIAGEKGLDETKWELYNLNQDRTELNNLAMQRPDLVKSMSGKWLKWANETCVYPKPGNKNQNN